MNDVENYNLDTNDLKLHLEKFVTRLNDENITTREPQITFNENKEPKYEKQENTDIYFSCYFAACHTVQLNFVYGERRLLHKRKSFKNLSG